MSASGQTSAPSSEMPRLAVDDIGVLSGVVIVDRLRTMAGELRDVKEHLQRFQHSCQAVGIELPDTGELRTGVLECAEQGRAGYEGDDFGLVLLATPGRLQDCPRQPTLILHTQPIAWNRLAHWYRVGQTLSISSVRNVPQSCWSPKIKTRARLHYYLADREAASRTGEPHSAALLLDQNGFVTETSSANVLLLEADRLISPRREMILDGVSLGRTLRLAAQRKLEIRFEDITVERAKAATAIWLCGSTGCLWKAGRLDETTFDRDHNDGLYTQLIDDWKREMGIDFVDQALQCAEPHGGETVASATR